MPPAKKRSYPSAMEKHGGVSSDFVRVVFNPVSQGIRLPTLFMENHGKSLHADTQITLKLPSGDSWSLRLRRTRTGLWLDRGWAEFAEFYGIKARHFLLFKYHGNAQFTVIVMDLTGSEIMYPIKDDEAQEEDEEEMVEFDANPDRIEGTIRKGEKEGFDSYQKAEGFKSENPFILAFMQPSYVSTKHPAIRMNSTGVRDFLPKRAAQQCTVKLCVLGSGKVWTTYWNVYSGGRTATVHRGWKEFAADNKLRVADSCVFELVDKAALQFNVTIFRNN